MTLLYALHAAISLAIEISLLKCAGLLFGMDLPATGTVLAVFIGGIAAGALLAERLPRRPGPYTQFGIVQCLIAVLAFLLPELLALSDRLWLVWADSSPGWLQLQRVICLSIFAGPLALVVGMAFPVAVRSLRPAQDGSSARGGFRASAQLSRLYAVGAFASAIGAWVGPVFLIPAVGNYTSLRWLGAASLANGVAAFWLARRTASRAARLPVQDEGPEKGTVHSRTAQAKAAQSATVSVRGDSSDPSPSSPLPWALQLVALLLGAALFVSEVGWLQLLWLSVDPTAYVTGSAIAVLILTMAAGAAVATALMRRGSLPRRVLSWSCTAAAAATLFSIGLGQEPALWARSWIETVSGLGGYLASTAWMAAASFGAAAFAHGAAVAALYGAARAASPRAGRTAARIAGLQALGNGLGALAGSFLLIPLLGLGGALASGVVLLIPCQLLPVLGSRRASSQASAAGSRRRGPAGSSAARRSRKKTVPYSKPGTAAWIAAAAATLAGAVLLPLLTDVAGTAPLQGEVVFRREDGTGLTEVLQMPQGHQLLLSNRLRQEGGDAPEQAFLERLQGYLPLLLHPDPKRVLVVGLGTGIALSPFRAPEVEHLVCVEISPGIVEAAGWFTPANRSILEDPRLQLRVSDGRNELRRDTDSYDLIVQDLFFPYASGSSSLYTLEHYRTIRSRLRQGGMAAQWISLAQVGTEDLRTLVATFQSVFAQTHLFLAGGYLSLIGSDAPLRIDIDDLEKRLRRPEVLRDLAYGPIEGPEDLMAMYLRGPREAQALGQGAALQTDDRLWIEFRAPQLVQRLNSTELTVENLTVATGILGDPVALFAASGNSKAMQSALQARSHLYRAIEQRFAGDEKSAARSYAAAYRLHPNQPQARQAVFEMTLTQGLRALEEGSPREARELLREAYRMVPDDPQAGMGLAVSLARTGADREAIAIYRGLLDQRPRLNAARFNLGLSLYRLGLYRQASDSFQAVLEQEPDAVDARFHLANSSARLGEFEKAIRLYRQVLRKDPDHEGARANLAAVLKSSDGEVERGSN